MIDNGGHNVVYARDHDNHHSHDDHLHYPKVISGRGSEGDRAYPHYNKETIISGDNASRRYPEAKYHKDKYLRDDEKD